MSFGTERRVVVFAAVLLLAGCGGGADEPRKTAESGGFATYELESAGFSVAVPDDWVAATAEEVFDEEAVDSVAEQNPEIKQFLDAVSREDSPIKLFAFDPDVEAGIATNLNVLVEEVPDYVDRDEYFEANVAQIEELVDPPHLINERVGLPAGDALHLVYEHEFTGRTLTAEQYGLFGDGKGYILTYTTLPERADDYADTFERSARSFSLG